MEVYLRSAAAPLNVSPLARVVAAVQPQLEEVAARVTRQTQAFDPAIVGYVSYALQSSGKRLRPLLSLLVARACGPVSPAHIDLAVIIELIHLATLVHDDIMDEAERRRNQPTVNARWGNALSVLLGDALFAHALDLSTRFDDAEISRAIARATRDVCTGEIIQTQRRFDLHLSVEEYFRIIELKTATLFATAAELGGKISGVAEYEVEAFARFGRQIGAAYQIYDDCVDLAGQESVCGKTLGTDLRKGKMTLPILKLLGNASALEKERYCQLILEGDLASIHVLLKTSCVDALDNSISAGEERVAGAKDALRALPAARATAPLEAMADAIGALLLSLREASA